MRSTTLIREDDTRGVGHGSHLRPPPAPDSLQCFRTGRVFGTGDVKARLPVAEDLEGVGLPQYRKDLPQLTRHIREDLRYTRTLRGRQGWDAPPSFGCADSGSDRLRHGILLSRADGTVR